LNRNDDNNKDRDQWDISQWDLDDSDSPDDFDEFARDEIDADELHLEVVSGIDEEQYRSRSVLVNNLIRLTAFLALLVFLSVFVLPSVIQGVSTFMTRPTEDNYIELITVLDPPLRFEQTEIKYSIVYPENASQSLINHVNGPLSRAFRSWSGPLGDRINFVPTPSNSTDDLLVTFVTELDSAGLATIRPGTKYRPQIFVRINVQGQAPSTMMLETVACHELGHALGLWGHSDWAGDCMYPIATRRTPSQRDLKTLIMVYESEGE